jgi:hypothetical protein
MVPILALWLPILVAAVIVFVASSIIHMAIPAWHKGDYQRLPNEDDVAAAMRKAGVTPGDYFLPYGGSMEAMKDPAFIKKMSDGPVVVMTAMQPGPPTMGRELFLWFLYCVVVSVFAAYVAGRALGPDAHYLAVFRFAGTVAFVGYSLALWQQSIWFKKAWSTTIKSTIDGLLYGLLTAGTFGWLWPR